MTPKKRSDNPSNLEENRHYRKGKVQGGYARSEIRSLLNMKDKLVKERNCLRCKKSFKSDAYRLCDECRDRRWAS